MSETALQAEVMLRLRTSYPSLLAIPIPNGIWPAVRNPLERQLTARLIHRAKLSGMLLPGVADLMIAGEGKAILVELKMPASRDLLGKKRAAGRLSDDQRAFQARCAECGVPYHVAHDWPEVEAAIGSVWG